MAVRVARRREESCLDSARSLLSTLQGRPSLANIVKPDWEAKETTSRAAVMLDQADKIGCKQFVTPKVNNNSKWTSDRETSLTL